MVMDMEVQPAAGRPSQRYSRDLPGGGFVAIAVERRWEGTREFPVTRVIVERRQPDRREGHQAPCIAEAEGDERSSAFMALFQLTRDNAALARAILDWQAKQSAAVQRAD
jgi:hypothetical protein